MPKMISGSAIGPVLLSETGAARRCPACGQFTHRWEDCEDTTERAHGDWTCSREGIQLVTRKFRKIFEAAGGFGAEFKPLSNGYFVFRPTAVIFLDYSDAGLRAEDLCPVCGRFDSFLMDERDVKLLKGQRAVRPLEVVRSGMQAGSGAFRPEDSIFGDEIAEAMRKSKLTGGLFWRDIRERE